MSEVSEPIVGKPSPKQQRFIEEYMIDLNGTQAAIRAGYSLRSAQQIASEHLSKPVIMMSIATLKRERAQRLQVEGDEVLQNWVLMNRGNVADYLPDGHPLKCMTRDQLYAITECTTTFESSEQGVGTTTVKIKLDDRLRSSDYIARHIGLFEADNRQKKAEVLTEEERDTRILAALRKLKRLTPDQQLLLDGMEQEAAAKAGTLIEGDVDDGEFVEIPQS